MFCGGARGLSDLKRAKIAAGEGAWLIQAFANGTAHDPR
jgi:hypothetical protein